MDYNAQQYANPIIGNGCYQAPVNYTYTWPYYQPVISVKARLALEILKSNLPGDDELVIAARATLTKELV